MRTSYIDFEHACRVADEYKTANEKNMAEKFKLKAQLEVAKRALEFYGNKENWTTAYCVADEMVFTRDDAEQKGPEVWHGSVAGKTARAALSEINEMGKQK